MRRKAIQNAADIQSMTLQEAADSFIRHSSPCLGKGFQV